MRRVKVLVGCCWGLEWEWERFVEEEDGGKLKNIKVTKEVDE